MKKSMFCLEGVSMFTRFFSTAFLVVSLVLGHLALGAAPAPAPAVTVNTMEGTYAGSMKLVRNKVTIPITISLVLTGEFMPIPPTPGSPIDKQQVIDGAILVDDEGGPYALSKVVFSLNQKKLYMEYFRPQTLVAPTQSADFQLVGTPSAAADGTLTISGDVISGPRTKLGTFSVVKKKLTMLVPHTKYVGTWVGVARGKLDHSVAPFTFIIESSGITTTNPPMMEFDFTPGKLGSFYYRRAPITSFSAISIDYLRRHIRCTYYGDPTHANTGIATIDADLDLDQGTMKGTFSSMYAGSFADIELVRQK